MRIDDMVRSRCSQGCSARAIKCRRMHNYLNTTHTFGFIKIERRVVVMGRVVFALFIAGAALNVGGSLMGVCVCVCGGGLLWEYTRH